MIGAARRFTGWSPAGVVAIGLVQRSPWGKTSSVLFNKGGVWIQTSVAVAVDRRHDLSGGLEEGRERLRGVRPDPALPVIEEVRVARGDDGVADRVDAEEAVARGGEVR